MKILLHLQWLNHHKIYELLCKEDYHQYLLLLLAYNSLFILIVKDINLYLSKNQVSCLLIFFIPSQN